MLELSLPVNHDDINLEEFGHDREYLIKLGHHGTHLDRVLKTVVPLDYFKNRALVFNVSQTKTPGVTTSNDIDLELIQPGDFIIFRTGIMEKSPYASKEYMAAPFDLDWELLDALLCRKIRFIGLDARGIRRKEDHYKADAQCEEAGVYVIENMTNLDKVPIEKPFTVYTCWFDLGQTGIPVRVIAEV